MKITPIIDLDKKDLVDTYNQAIIDLDTIINRTNPTNAQVIWAVREEAKIIKKLAKFIKGQI